MFNLVIILFLGNLKFSMCLFTELPFKCKLQKTGCYAGSAVESTCSCRGPCFSHQHPYDSLPASYTFSTRISDALLWPPMGPANIWHTPVHEGKPFRHIK